MHNNHFPVHQELTQNCKSTILPKKKELLAQQSSLPHVPETADHVFTGARTQTHTELYLRCGSWNSINKYLELMDCGI